MTLPLIACLAGFAFLLFVEAWAAPKKYEGGPAWMPYATVAAMIAFYIGAGFLFARMLAHALSAPSTYRFVLGLVGFVVGVWIASIGLQFAQNAIRRAQKREPVKIRWISDRLW